MTTSADLHLEATRALRFRPHRTPLAKRQLLLLAAELRELGRSTQVPEPRPLATLHEHITRESVLTAPPSEPKGLPLAVSADPAFSFDCAPEAHPSGAPLAFPRLASRDGASVYVCAAGHEHEAATAAILCDLGGGV